MKHQVVQQLKGLEHLSVELQAYGDRDLTKIVDHFFRQTGAKELSILPLRTLHISTKVLSNISQLTNTNTEALIVQLKDVEDQLLNRITKD